MSTANQPQPLVPLLQRNRYDSDNLIAQLKSQKPSRDIDKSCYLFKNAGADLDDFPVYFPDVEAEYDSVRGMLTDFLTQIQNVDNQIQESLETEHRATKIAIENYRVYIGWTRVSGHEVTVRYWGSDVNTEYEAVFRQERPGCWLRIDDKRPMYRRPIKFT